MFKLVKWICFAVIAICLWLAGSVIFYAFTDQKTKADCAIILGAAAWYKRPSPVFEERIRHGIWLYQNNYVKKLILTGGKSKNAPYSEAFVAKRYALRKNIPENDILIEEDSLTTQENLINAKKIMAQNQLNTAIIVSDPMHMYRALSVAKDLHMLVYSSPTPTTRFESVKSNVNFLIQETYHMIGYLLTSHSYRYSPNNK